VPGQQQCHRLIPDLRIGESVSTVGQDERGQQIAGIDSRRPPLDDHVVDKLTQARAAPAQPSRRTDRHVLQTPAERDESEPIGAQQVGDGPLDCLDVGVHIGAEQGDAGRRQRHADGLGVDVDGSGSGPPSGGGRGLRGHHLGVSLDPVGMEGGLDQSTVVTVDVALGGEQPVTKDDA